jgi:hypothetical protein
MIKRIAFDAEPAADSTAERIVVCTVLPDLTPAAPHERVCIEWFTNSEAALRASTRHDTVVADEYILRGAEWLDERWRSGDAKLKHMALAIRAAGLTPEQFSEKWRSHAGTASTVVIPDRARGQAYAQNHPKQGDWAYDAVNEVWFDTAEDLRFRIEWFAENAVNTNDALVGAAWFLAVREEVVR